MRTETHRAARLKIAIIAAFIAVALIGFSSQRATQANSPAQSSRAKQPSQKKNPLAATQRNTALGLNHFDAHCASCHAATGKADTDMGKAVGAADLTSPKTQSKSDAELFRIISRGVPGTAMPAFAKSHSPTEIWQTILFIRKLPTLTHEEREKLEAAVPASARHKHDAHHDHDMKEHEQKRPETKPPAETPQAEHKHGETMKENKPAQPAAEQPQHEHHHEAAKPAPEKPAERDGHAQHQHQTQAGEMKRDAQPGDEHAAHDTSAMAGKREMGSMHGAHDVNAMMSTITGGPFKAMTAIGSGTSLMPASAPGYMWHWMKGDWMIMAHGDLKVGLNHQGGPRGVNKAESQNWFMLMAEREAGKGRLMLRGMFSAEPWTAPRRGFPQLFQTGETFEGRPIIDAQHPHDLFMELAVGYTHPLSENVSINLYGGPVGEPALGPVAFMHRASAAENPSAPLGHHWQDSTHIAHGVFTAGVTAWKLRVEGSIFRGAEPDENRKDIELGKLDSYSGRIWFTPTPNWAMQFSMGHLTKPEALEPGDLNRMTASVSYNRTWRDGNWATSLIWGRNHEEHGNSNAYLLESTANFADKNYLFMRLELGDKIGLLQENIWGRAGLLDEHNHASEALGDNHELDRWFRVGAFTFGGVRDIVAESFLRVGIGADVTFYHVPGALKPIYGSSPTSFQLFLRLRPGKMSH
ncbi:MAG TPA: c-type cytochrome [Blastocatellia bacterium]|nr:c-type cytochrome [Blastocatellia bacterium]